MEEAGEEPGAQVGAVGFVKEAAPGVGVEAADPLAEDGVELMPSAEREVMPRKMKEE